MDIDPALPESKGRRTMLTTLYRLAELTPDRIFGSYALALNLDHGFRDVTFREITQAIDALAWYIEKLYGKGRDFETILYMGVSDYRYCLMCYACVKAGYKALFVSPRNPQWQNIRLLEDTACTRAFYSIEMEEVVVGFQSKRKSLQAQILEPWDHWLRAYTTPYPYKKTWDESKWDPFLVLHSSGSTGPPKPIALPQGYFAGTDAEWPAFDDRDPPTNAIGSFDLPGGGHVWSQFPTYHMVGFAVMCTYPVLNTSMSPVYGPVNADPTNAAATLMQLMLRKRVRIVYSSPLVVEQLSKLPGGMEALLRLDGIVYMGGPLAPSIGNRLEANGVKIFMMYGTTELGSVPLMRPRKGDWEWLEIHSAYSPVMEPVPGAHNACELVIHNKGDGRSTLRGTYWTEPGVKIWRTKDMFIPHPVKPDLWKFIGRTDDILLMSHGHKINPVPMESALLGNSAVTGALITGVNRWPPCALIEPKVKCTDRELFLRDLSSDLSKANDLVQCWAHIRTDMIAILEPNSLVRAPKGTVVRRQNAEAHAGIIDGMYDRYECLPEQERMTW